MFGLLVDLLATIIGQLLDVLLLSESWVHLIAMLAFDHFFLAGLCDLSAIARQ